MRVRAGASGRDGGPLGGVGDISGDGHVLGEGEGGVGGMGWAACRGGAKDREGGFPLGTGPRLTPTQAVKTEYTSQAVVVKNRKLSSVDKVDWRKKNHLTVSPARE